MRTMPCTTSGSSSWPTMPRRGACADRHVGHVAHADRRALLLGDDDVLDVVRAIRMRPMPRTLNDCSPMVRRCPPTFWLRVRDGASMSCASVTPWPRSRKGSTSTWYCLVSPPKLTTSMTPGHLLELALEDPVLGGLQVASASSPCPRTHVAEDLADGVPRRELRPARPAGS